jgi:hypothetical protein
MGAPTHVRKTVAASGTETFTQLPSNTTVHIQPGSGGTMTAKIKVHASDTAIDLDPNTTTYSAAATRVLLGPVHSIIVTAATAAGAASVSY